MNHHSDGLRNLEVVDQYRSLADGYLFVAIKACEILVADPSQVTYSRCSACYFNARLSVELFLKALIHKQQGSVDVSHHIEKLRDRVLILYPELTDIWDIPFCTEFLGFYDLQKAQDRFLKDYPIDQVLRYPTNKSGSVWSGVMIIEPGTFLQFLTKIQSDILKVSSSVFG